MNSMLYRSTTIEVQGSCTSTSELEFPYRSNYLQNFIDRSMIEIQASETIKAMQEWLTETVNHGGENNYKWGTETFLITVSGEHMTYSISFKHKQDLTAFRLRWGITS